MENAEVRTKVQAAKEAGTSSEESRRAIFEGLETQIAASDRKAEVFNNNYEATLRSMDGIKSYIVAIFQKVGCSDESTAERLLATGVTESTIMTFLGLIEQVRRCWFALQRCHPAVLTTGCRPRHSTCSACPRFAKWWR